MPNRRDNKLNQDFLMGLVHKNQPNLNPISSGSGQVKCSSAIHNPDIVFMTHPPLLLERIQLDLSLHNFSFFPRYYTFMYMFQPHIYTLLTFI